MATNEDLISELGALALGSRLRRLSELIYNQGEEIYSANAVELKPSLFPCFYAVAVEGGQSITELATRLQVTHPAVHKMIRGLLDLKLVKESRDDEDERRRVIRLSTKGEKLVEKLLPLWRAIAEAVDNLLQEEAPKFLLSLTQLEDALKKKPLGERLSYGGVRPKDRPQVEIVSYLDSLAPAFYELNAEWINEYFTLEEHDKEMLQAPREYFIDQGGEVFFALLDGEPVGTCAMLPSKNEEGVLQYELTKMAVSPKAQGNGIGKRLCISAIDYAKRKGGKIVWLESNTVLSTAIKMYRSLGFVERERRICSEYERCNIYMELDL